MENFEVRLKPRLDPEGTSLVHAFSEKIGTVCLDFQKIDHLFSRITVFDENVRYVQNPARYAMVRSWYTHDTVLVFIFVKSILLDRLTCVRHHNEGKDFFGKFQPNYGH